MSNKQNENLGVGDVLQFLGLLLLGLGCFIGYNFMFEGSLSFSIPLTIVTLIVVFGIVYVLRVLKGTKRYQSQMKIWEYMILILGYIGIIGFGTLFVFTHFMNIQVTLKDQIQDKASDYIVNTEKVISGYENHVNELKSEFDTEMDNALKNVYYDNESENFKEKYKMPGLKESNKDQYLDAFEDSMFSVDYEKLRSDIEKFNSNANVSLIDGWNPLIAPETYYQLEEKYDSTKSQLIKISKNHIRAKEDPFQPSDYVNSLNKLPDLSKPINFINQTNWLVTLLLFFIIHLFILWPYLFMSRHDKSGVINFSDEDGDDIIEM